MLSREAMAPKMPQSSSAVAADPFELLSQQIAAARRKKGSIILPNNTAKAIKTELKALVTHKAYVPNAHIANLVSALDQNGDNCSRLEDTTFGLILDALLHARYSRNKERGIILLAASIYHESHKRASPRTQRTKKATIGKEYIQQLMICFTNADEEVRIRRWIGILILQLLRGSDINRMAFEAGPEDNKRKLGTMVVGEQNEILRIICGQLLKALMAWDVPKRDLWPIGTDKKHYDRFPASSQSDKHWNNAFQTYIDELFLNSALPQGSGNIYFAQALKSSPPGPQMTGSIINILIGRDVSVFTQSSDTVFAESLEIPFHLIEDVTIDDTLLEQSIEVENPPVDLVIHLKTVKDVLCYRNALPVSLHQIRITVQDEDLANTIGADILEPRSGQKVSQSMETIAIAPVLDDYTSSQEIAPLEDSKEEHMKSPNDAATVFQESKLSANSESVIRESPQDNRIQDTSTKFGQQVRQKAPEVAVVAVTSQNQEKHDEAHDSSLVVGDVSFHASVPATIPPGQAHHNAKAPTEKEDYALLKVNRRGRKPSNGTHLAKATQQQPAPEPNDADSDELSDPPSSSVESPVAQSRQRNSAGSKAKTKIKPKAKKAVLKPAVPKEETLKVKKYSLKPKAAPVITKKRAPRASAPKASGPRATAKSASARKLALVPKISVPKASASQPVPKAVSAAKPALAPKTAAALVAKETKEATSKSLLIKKPPVKAVVKQSTHQSPSPPSNADQSPQHGEAVDSNPTNVKEQTTTEIDRDTQEILAQVDRATRRRAGRLSAALAVLDEMERLDESFGELAQPNFEDHPAQMATEVESSSSSLSRGSPQALEEAADVSGYATRQVTPVQIQTLEAPTGPRRNPRLAAVRTSKMAVATQNSVSMDEPPLFNDYLARKTPLVSFGATGPRNQGTASPKKSSIPRKRELSRAEKPEKCLLINQTHIAERKAKRKRNIEDAPVRENNKQQPKSRLQKSKTAVFTTDRELPLAFRDVRGTGIEGNPAALRHTTISGSQGSRVDENGSPRGFSNSLQERANYRMIAEKVLMDVKPIESNDEDDGDGFFHHEEDERVPAVDQSDDSLLLNLPLIPSSSMKPGPLSPDPIEQVSHRYIPHKKSTSSRYKDVGTKVVIPQQGQLVDPFLEKGTEIERSNFARRLQYGRQMQTNKSSDHPLQASQRKTRFTLNDDLEATLVNVENENSIQEYSPSSDRTSGSSNESQNSQPRTSIVQVDQTTCDEWRMALKPYQRGILEALYQVSNDLVRYLISHEQAIEDVLVEYQMGGTKLMEQLEKDHQDNKRRAHYEVEKIIKAMEKEYRDSKQHIMRNAEELKCRPLRQVEKEWMQKQDQMERLIEEGMKQCR